MPRIAGRSWSVPRIEDVEPVKAPEVLEISRHDGHFVDQGGRADEGVAERCGVGHMEGGGTACHSLVHRDHPVLESGGHALVEPRAKYRSLCWVGTLHEQHAVLEFLHRDRGDEQLD